MMDEFVSEQDDMLVLVAAGNSGPGWQVSSCVVPYVRACMREMP
jgi:hypothetical protein